MNQKSKRSGPFDGRVVPIDETVRSVIELYLNQFKNYEDAAREIGINRDTIVKYNTFSQSMALYIFEKIVRYLRGTDAGGRLSALLPPDNLAQLLRGAQPSDHAQKDHIMYAITPVMANLLKMYIKPFANIGAAGASLGINPRTFKAYLDGTIESIPQRYFWRLIDGLKRQGYVEQDLMSSAGISTWREILEERRRTPTLKSDADGLLDLILQHIREGKRQRKDFPRELVNACYRVFGNFGDAVRLSMTRYQENVAAEIRECLSEGMVRKAHSLVAKLRSDFEAFDEVQQTVYKALPKRKRSQWLKELPRFKDVRKELNELLENFELDTSRQYRMDASYKINDILHHPGFGLGRVVKLQGPNRMVVDFFKRGMGQRILIMNS